MDEVVFVRQKIFCLFSTRSNKFKYELGSKSPIHNKDVFLFMGINSNPHATAAERVFLNGFHIRNEFLLFSE